MIRSFNFVVYLDQFMRLVAEGGDEEIGVSEIESNMGLWSLDKSLRF